MLSSRQGMQRAPVRAAAPHVEQVVWSEDVIGVRRPNDSATRPAGRMYCSQSAMAGFVARLARRIGPLIFVFRLLGQPSLAHPQPSTWSWQSVLEFQVHCAGSDTLGFYAWAGSRQFPGSLAPEYFCGRLPSVAIFELFQAIAVH